MAFGHDGGRDTPRSGVIARSEATWQSVFFYADRGLFSFSSEKGTFRAPARVTFGRSPKSDQKVCLKPQVSRLPARYIPVIFGSLYRTVAEIFLCRAVKRIVSASAPLPLVFATVEPIAPAFQSKSGSEKRSRDNAAFR